LCPAGASLNRNHGATTKVNGLTEFVKTLGPARLAAMGAVAVGLIGFFVFLLLRFSQPQMGVLFTDLTFEDSIGIVKRLEGMDVPHEVRQEGAIILVPKDRVLRLRMNLAEDGLPAGGAVGYEIFDNSDTLGSTSFVQNINHLRAIEGELARTIRSIGRVQSARVHLVLPQRRLFAKRSAEPSASIVVTVRGTLDKGQIKAIQHLVASAVEELKPGRVSIVDETGRLLANGRGDDANAMSDTLDERGRAIESRMQREIEEIVASVVGADRARVRITAEMDYNKITETSDVYDPDGQVVRSTQSREESASAATPTTDDGVSVGNELPSANAEANNGTQQERSSKTEEVVNYEISRTTKTEVVEGGRIKRLSVAVLVDGQYERAAGGQVKYTPRTAEELEKITKLVQSAIGFDKERGDQVHVSNLRFAKTEVPQAADTADGGMFDFTKAEYFHIAELTIIALVSILVLLFVVRPLIRRIVTPEVEQSLEDLAVDWKNQSAGALEGPGKEGGEKALLEAPDSVASRALKEAKIVGEIQAHALREVGEIVENNPEEATTIVRNWIQDAA
jgi:flagellar M-ring protein FliF